MIILHDVHACSSPSPSSSSPLLHVVHWRSKRGHKGTRPCPTPVDRKVNKRKSLCHLHNLPLIMSFNVHKLPFCPPPPLPRCQILATPLSLAHSPGSRELVYATTKPTKNAVLIHTFSKITLPWEGDSLVPHPPPLGRFAPSLCPPPPLTYHGYTTVTGVAKGVQGPAPPPPIDWRD